MSHEITRAIWEYTHVVDGGARLTTLLEQGWEPFAVTTEPDGMRVHQHDGTTVYYARRVHLRRVSRNKVCAS